MGAATAELTLQAVGAIYEAVDDRDSWIDVIHRIASLFGASRACLFYYGHDRHDVVSTALDDGEFNSPQGRDAHFYDPLGQAHMAMSSLEIRPLASLIDVRAFRRRPLWQDWYKPRDMYDGVSACVHDDGHGRWFLDVQRGPRQAPFAAADTALANRLIPHLTRALRMSAKGPAFDQIGVICPGAGAAIVDRAGSVVRINDFARAMLDGPGPLSIRAGRLHAGTEAETRRLRSLIMAAAMDPFASSPHKMLAGLRDGFEASETVLVSVQPHQDGSLTWDQHVLVVLQPHGNVALASSFDETVGRMFGLTSAEAGIARALASGLSVREAAEAAEVTYNTARTYLARIFEKTGTQRQSQLVAVLVNATSPLAALEPASGWRSN